MILVSCGLRLQIPPSHSRRQTLNVEVLMDFFHSLQVSVASSNYWVNHHNSFKPYCQCCVCLGSGHNSLWILVSVKVCGQLNISLPTCSLLFSNCWSKIAFSRHFFRIQKNLIITLRNYFGCYTLLLVGCAVHIFCCNSVHYFSKGSQCTCYYLAIMGIGCMNLVIHLYTI